MSRIEKITWAQEREWNGILRRFPMADVYYTREYVHAFSRYGDGEPWLLYFEDGDFSAMNVVMARTIVGTEYLDFSTVYGYGGFLFSKAPLDQGQKLARAYGDFCREQGVISEFVRFHPVLCNGPQCEALYDVKLLGNTVCMRLDSPDFIWNQMTSKNRNKIRKAIKSGVEVGWGWSRELFDRFEELYRVTMERDEAEDYYYFSPAFFQDVMEDLAGKGRIFYSLLQGRVIAASIILTAGRQMHYHLSASLPEYRVYAPTNLLLYQAACWGSENGYASLHLGGGLGCREDSLYAFKKTFYRGEDTRFYIGKQIYSPEVYQALSASAPKDTSFFPAYRAKG